MISPSRRSALGVGALLALPFAGHLAEADHGDADEDSHAADAGGMTYRLDAQRPDGSTAAVESTAPLDGVRAALAQAGFRTDVRTAPSRGDVEATDWRPGPAADRRRRKGRR